MYLAVISVFKKNDYRFVQYHSSQGWWVKLGSVDILAPV